MLGYVFGDTEDLPREMKTKWKFRERPAGAIQGQRDRGASWRLLAAPGPSAGGLVPQVKVLATGLDDTLDARTPPGGKRRLTPSRCPLTSTSTTVCAPTQINEKLKKKIPVLIPLYAWLFPVLGVSCDASEDLLQSSVSVLNNQPCCLTFSPLIATP